MSKFQANLRLRERVDPGTVVRRIVSQPGVLGVSPVFPGDSDEFLRRMFLVDLDPAMGEGLLAKIGGDQGVEFIEPTNPKRVRRGRA